MKEDILKNRINDLILNDMVCIEEYQDKFYFVKKLKTIFPELTEDLIYKAIDSTNRSINPPRKKRKYINLLTNKLLNFNAGY